MLSQCLGDPSQKADARVPFIVNLDECIEGDYDLETLHQDFMQSSLQGEGSRRRPYNMDHSRTANVLLEDETLCQRWLRHWVIDPSMPRSARWLDWWDTHFIMMIFAVAIVTPYEVAFTFLSSDLFFNFDRIADVSFALHIILQFFMAYPDPNRPARYVKEPFTIMIKYLKGWFIPDALTMVPVDVLFFIAHQLVVGEGAATDTFMLRSIYSLRLLRMARFTACFERFTHAYGLSFAKLTLLKFLVSLILCCHWMACIWGGMAIHLKQHSMHNWLSALEAAKSGDETLYHDSFEVYMLGLYSSIVTLTSIGYGDITPQCLAEYMISCISMATMAGMWAYVIGSVCSIASSLHPQDRAFQRTMDDLNNLMSDRNMPMEMRSRFRRYFHEARDMARTKTENSLIEKMSPMLQGECALFIHSEWIKKISYLNRLSDDVVFWAARRLQLMVYAPNEEILSERVANIVRRGVVIQGGKVRFAGAVWGEDMLLSNRTLRDLNKARALSYLSLLRLTFHDVLDVVASFPEAKYGLRRARMRIAIVRGMNLLAATFRRWKKSGAFDLWQLPEHMRQSLYSEILSGCTPPDSCGTTAGLRQLFDDPSMRMALCLPVPDEEEPDGYVGCAPNEDHSSSTDVVSALNEVVNVLQALSSRITTLERDKRAQWMRSGSRTTDSLSASLPPNSSSLRGSVMSLGPGRHRGVQKSTKRKSNGAIDDLG